jgi:hypothetical protein
VFDPLLLFPQQISSVVLIYLAIDKQLVAINCAGNHQELLSLFVEQETFLLVVVGQKGTCPKDTGEAVVQ